MAKKELTLSEQIEMCAKSAGSVKRHVLEMTKELATMEEFLPQQVEILTRYKTLIRYIENEIGYL